MPDNDLDVLAKRISDYFNSDQRLMRGAPDWIWVRAQIAEAVAAQQRKDAEIAWKMQMEQFGGGTAIGNAIAGPGCPSTPVFTADDGLKVLARRIILGIDPSSATEHITRWVITQISEGIAELGLKTGRSACEACGIIGASEYIYVRTLNGGLHLCAPCLSVINQKNPELKELKAAEARYHSVIHQAAKDLEAVDQLREAAVDAAQIVIKAAEARVAKKSERIEELVQLCESADARADRAEDAIRKHRDQRGDDRCWMDDQELYAVLGDGNLGDNTMPGREAFLANCARYYERRCQAGTWPSYQELEQRAVRAEASAAKMRKDLVDFIQHYAGYKGGKGVIGTEVTKWLERFETLVNADTAGQALLDRLEKMREAIEAATRSGLIGSNTDLWEKLRAALADSGV